jgi:biopolymer transport protein ExbD
MAEKRRFLDVWIVESNTVYREVPFEVVVDWVQQGRLLEDDMLRWSGQADWFPLGSTPIFSAYLPHAEPFRAEDEAEALEPVQVDFTWRRRDEDDDEDVDMIPLIDVSLVLLVFFMLTATGASMSAFVKTPEVENTLTADNADSVRIDIKNDDGKPIYSVGAGNRHSDPDERDLSDINSLSARLKARLDRMEGPVEVVINADRDLPAGHVRTVLLLLRTKPFRDRIKVHYYGATQRDE